MNIHYMCGLFGTIGNVPNKTAVLRSLSLSNMERGTDSTGVADIDVGTGKYTIRKAPMNASKFMPNIKLSQGSLVIGHTRHATSGKINTKNAHPWRIGNIIGCHNGMVFNEYSLKKYMATEHKDKTHYNVDSQYLLHLMDRYGHLGTATGMLNLTYWDINKKCFVMCCYNNPLHLGISIDNRWAVWSSDKKHLEKALNITSPVGSLTSMDKELFEIRIHKGKLDVEIFDVPFDEEHRNKHIYAQSDYTSYGWEGYHSPATTRNGGQNWWKQYEDNSSKSLKEIQDEQDEILFGNQDYGPTTEYVVIDGETVPVRYYPERDTRYDHLPEATHGVYNLE